MNHNVTPEADEIITKARSILERSTLSTASTTTIADYESEFNRLFIKRMEFGGDIWKAAAQTQRVTTWFKRRASILYVLRKCICGLVTKQERLQEELKNALPQDSRWALWRELVSNLSGASAVFRAAPVGAPLVMRAKRQSKRRLGGVPIDWREQLSRRLPRWRIPFLVAAVTGCRPAELVKGVVMEVHGDDLKARITGAKVGLVSGQEWRQLSWNLIASTSPLIRQLAAHVRQNGGKCLVDLGTENINPARAFSDGIRAAAKRAWPKRKSTITAYSLRHAAASDMKSSALSSDEISASLGHVAIATKSSYGQAARGLRSSVAPQKVTAARIVRGQPTVRPVPKFQLTERGS